MYIYILYVSSNKLIFVKSMVLEIFFQIYAAIEDLIISSPTLTDNKKRLRKETH